MKSKCFIAIIAGLIGFAAARLSIQSKGHEQPSEPPQAEEVTKTNVVTLVVYKTNVIQGATSTIHGRNLADRDYRAGRSAEEHIEYLRPEYTDFLTRIGASGDAIDRILREMPAITRLAFLAEAASMDLMTQQLNFTNMLAQVLTPEQFGQFLAHEHQRPVEKEFQKLTEFAFEKSAQPLSEKTAETLRKVIEEHRVFTSGTPVLGPLDPAPVPSFGLEASLQRFAKERAEVVAMRDAALQPLNGVASSEELQLVGDYYNRNIAARDELRDMKIRANDPELLKQMATETREERRARRRAQIEEIERKSQQGK